MKAPEQKSNRMQLDGFYYEPRKEPKTSPFWNPVSFVQNRLSKKEIEKRKYAKVTAEYDGWMTKVYQKYNPQYVQEITGLSEDKIEDFMKFCKLPDSFISLSSQYEVVVAIQKCLGKYATASVPPDTLRDN